MTEEKKTFDAEVGKILHLMIHSLYGNKEIFMRELISNASDACDKLRYLSQTNTNLLAGDTNLKITVKVDKDNKQIIIRDSGIGMNKEDLIENLGTIAKSGTQNFLEQLSGDAKKDNMLIGQFGVGFYSAFMVADYITVTSKKAGEDKSYTWHSDGLGEYTVSDTDREFTRGTEVVVDVKEAEDSFLDHFKLKNIVKTYSDHIAVPIYFIDGSDNEIQLNSSSALWTRPKTEITKEQYQEFYKSLSHSWDEPWLTIHNKNEGAIEFTNLLFIPSNKPYDLFQQDHKKKVKLYIKRVFISDENVDLVPTYLRFLCGVVDSEDLPLNISRETLQHNTTLEKIKTSIIKKVISKLKMEKDNSIEDYLKFWINFGVVLKEGLCEAMSEHEKLLEVCMFRSTLRDKLISLDDYISNCHEGQRTIYYLSGDDATKLRSSPQIEGFISKGIDVLLFTDAVDNFWVNTNNSYKDYEIKSATRSDIDLEKIHNIDADKDTEEQDEDTDIDTNTENNDKRKDKSKNTSNKKAKKNDKDKNTNATHCAEYTKLLEYFKQVLGSLVKDVKISKKLTSSIACLAVSDSAMDIHMERLLKQQNRLPSSAAKILELNPKHKIIEKINDNLKNDLKPEEAPHDNEQLVKLIFDQACITEGEPVHDAGEFSKRLNDVLYKLLSLDALLPLENG